MKTKDFPAVIAAHRFVSNQMEFYRKMMNAKPHEQRVIKEKEELDIKLEALRSFIHTSDIYLTLPSDERSRLFNQKLAMENYSDILGQRIKCFTQTN